MVKPKTWFLTLRHTGKDMVEVSDFMTFVTSYNIALEP